MHLDIVIPAYNEERRIGPMLDAYRERIRGENIRFHIALDRCTDRTAEVVGRHMAADPRVLMNEHPKLGKGGVIMETFRRCEGDLIGFVDADCATPPGELLRLADVAARGADGAIASRRHPASVLPVRRPLARELTSGYPLFPHSLSARPRPRPRPPAGPRRAAGCGRGWLPA